MDLSPKNELFNTTIKTLVFALLGTLLLMIVSYMLGHVSAETSTRAIAPKYTEEPYNLKDGTSCVILRGGTHSGMIGITCNYDEKPE